MKDTAYASLFDKKDIPFLRRMAKKIRLTHDQSILDNFNKLSQQKLNDHHPLLEIGNKKVEFLQVAKSDSGDLVLNTGMSWCLDQIIGAKTVRWAYITAGTGTTPPLVTQVGLDNSVVSQFMNISGWQETASASLRFGVVFGESVASITVNETCIAHAGPPNPTLLNRNVYSIFPIAHSINFTGFVISNIIEFVPIMS